MKKLSAYWAVAMVAACLVLVLIVTLFPFRFTARDPVSLAQIVNHFSTQAGAIDDLTANVLLFVPLGFGLAGMLQKRWSRKSISLMIIILLSGSLSLLVETLQVFLPLRSASFIDLLTNTIGGALGAVLFNFWQIYFPLRNQILKTWGKYCLTPRKEGLGALAYGSFLTYLIISLQHTTHLGNWDPSFPLVIGNEETGDRPWNGTISELYISNQALTEPEIARLLGSEQPNPLVNHSWKAAYQLTGKGNYPDLSGHLPDLEWQGNPLISGNSSISLTQQHWLATPRQIPELSQAIRQSSQFSLLTTVGTANVKQSGPARIVSISADSFQRNLMIGQQDSHLVVRIRTPISGKNGNYPELVFPGVFANSRPHRLIFTYNHASLRLYMDDMEQPYTMTLSPEILFFRFVPAIGIRSFQITPTSQWILKIIFYVFVLIPPAVVLAGVRRISQPTYRR
ncbi:MAG: VanZ family protein [Kovacikia sp.]